MANESNRPIEFFGSDMKKWAQYMVEEGPEAYKYKGLYEEKARQLGRLYRYAEHLGIELPNPSSVTVPEHDPTLDE